MQSIYQLNSGHQLISGVLQLSDELDDAIVGSILQPNDSVALLQAGVGGLDVGPLAWLLRIGQVFFRPVRSSGPSLIIPEGRPAAGAVQDLLHVRGGVWKEKKEGGGLS